MPLPLLLCLGLCAADAGTEVALSRHERTQIRMGVPVTITVYAPGEAVANRAFTAAFDRIRVLNDLLSDYDPDSELMRLCRNSRPGQPVEVSPELFFVLQQAEKLSRESQGAFDVTIGPVVQLWRAARRTRQLPQPDELEAARKRVNFRNIQLNDKNRTVELKQTDMRLDLGGIAKGYAADEALKALKAHGVSRALVAVAGDIVAGDPPPGLKGWKVGLGPANDPDAPPKQFLELANAAVSTSGDAFQFVELNGKRYSHIVDPKTGLGVTRRCTATVIAPSGIESDSLASALCILDSAAGLKLIQSRRNTESRILIADESGTLTESRTDGFPLRDPIP